MVVGVNGTAGIWATYPQEFVTTPTALGDQVNDQFKKRMYIFPVGTYSSLDDLVSMVTIVILIHYIFNVPLKSFLVVCVRCSMPLDMV